MVNVVVVGTGMYVCGRGTDTYGTVLPALFEAHKMSLGKDIHVVGRSNESLKSFSEKEKALKRIMGVSPHVSLHLQEKEGEATLLEVLRKIPRPAVAIVVVPDHVHFEVVSSVIEEGMHVLVVKPLAQTVKEVECLISMQEEAGIYGAVEFHKRFDHSNLKMKEIVDSGKIGTPLYSVVEYSQKKIVPEEIFAKWSSKTNVFSYLGVHYVDMIYFVTRAMPVRVTATSQKTWLAKKGIDTYDAIQAMVEWELPENKGRMTSIFLTNWIDPNCMSAMSDQKIKIIGTKGRYEADQKHRGIQVITDENGIMDINPDFSEFYLDPDGKTMSFKGYGPESIIQFIKDARAIESGEISWQQLAGMRPTFREALVSTQVIEAASLSLKREGEWVSINSTLKGKQKE